MLPPTLSAIDITTLFTTFLSKYWWILLIIIALKIFRLPSVKGWFGEQLVNRALKRLPATDYHLFHDFYLPRPDGKGTTHIDHLVVSRFGLFVIETKNYQGWIFGSEKQRTWTQQIYKKKHKFQNPLHQNPLHQNALHINALIHFLQLEKSVFHNLVYFVGDCTLKTKLPENVLTHGLPSFIKGHQKELLTESELTHCLEILKQTVTNKPQAAKQHVKQLKQRKAARGLRSI
ncbi:nuclease-related domain-containing protein [Rubritalea spongiae]|uniref:Nuclease-related domain-containing protein n=1 Tax=Rubritalea spongiae TaxID=430797 RepID=A0ABW5E533_9BACT